MPISVVMPALEIAQETGKLIAWRKKEGESVFKGETLLEIETDKAVMEVEAPGDGILAGVKVHAGAEVPVGQTIAWILRPGEVPPPEVASSETSGRIATSSARPASAASAALVQQAGAGPKMSPKARRLARESGVDLSRIRGSGPDGAILAGDLAAAAGVQSSGMQAFLEKLGPVGRLMAERTTQSWTTVPHFFVVREIDAGALVKFRERMALPPSPSEIHPTYTDILVGLVARALVKHPRLNGSWTGDGIRINSEVNVAIAMAVDEGVVAAVIHKANEAGLARIAEERHALGERARAGRLHPADISGGTFTLSNLGMYHADAFSAIITPPQAAVLAVGQISERVVAVKGHPGIRSMMTMTLSCDHRVVDGARAAAFLNDLADAVGEPEEWLSHE